MSQTRQFQRNINLLRLFLRLIDVFNRAILNRAYIMEQITIREFFSPFEEKRKLHRYLLHRHSSFDRFLAISPPLKLEIPNVISIDSSSFDLSSEHTQGDQRISLSLSLREKEKFQLPFDSFLECRKREIPNGRNFHRLLRLIGLSSKQTSPPPCANNERID